MSVNIDKDSIIKLANAIIGQKCINSLLNEGLPVLMEIIDCSIISVFQKDNRMLKHIATLPNSLKETDDCQKASESIIKQCENNPGQDLFYANVADLNCYGFKLKGFGLLIICLQDRYPMVFLNELKAVTDMIAQGCNSCSDLSSSTISNNSFEYLPQARQRALMDNLPFIAWILDEKGVFTAVNKSFAHEYGLVIKDIIGQRPEDILPPKLHNKFKSCFESSRINTRASVRKDVAPTLKGDIWMEQHKASVLGYSGEYLGTIGFLEDSSEKRFALKQLIEGKEIFSQLAHYLDDVIWIMEPDKIIYLSPGYEKIWGRPVQGLMNNPEAIFNTVHFHDREKLFKGLEAKFFSEGKVNVEFRVIRPDGEIRWIKLKSYPIRDKSGKIIMRGGICKDITDTRKLFLKLNEYKNRLADMVEEKTRALVNINYLLEQEISERKKVHELLTRSRETLRSVLDSTTHLAFLVDYDGHVLAINKNGAKALGTIPQSIVGRNASKFMEWGWFEYLMEKLHDALCAKKTLNFEHVINGLNYDVQISPITSDSGQAFRAVIFLHDITELMQAKEAIRESEQRLRSLVDNIPVIIHAHDEKGNYIFWNKESERILGYTSDQMLNNPRAVELVYPDEDAREKAVSCWHGGEINEPCEIEALTSTGEKKLIKWTRLSDKFSIPGWADWEVGLDVTTQRRFEADLKQAKLNAEMANNAKSRFLANVSHEIRTPLSGIIGLANMTLDSTLNLDQKKNLEQILSLSSHLLQTISDILDISKVETGKFSFEKRDFDLRKVLMEIEYSLIYQARDKQLELVINHNPDASNHLIGDSFRLKQVLFNLVGNAIKFTEQGRIVVDYSVRERDKNNILLLFRVTDTGIGISRKDHDKLFRAFSQVDGSYSRKHGGTGLGLYICKHIVKMMGGDIWFESEPARGSVFYFTAWFEENPEKICDNDSAITKAGNQHIPLKILLVEDFPVNQVVISEMLKKSGHLVHVAGNGEQALKNIEESTFDLVLMDLQLPEMDGFETTKLIRKNKNPKIASIPVVALTAHSMDSNINQTRQAGMNEMLIKPVNQADLLKTINRVVQLDRL
jgi:PAS domain S-box-containing protein